MSEAKFLISKNEIKRRVGRLKEIGLGVSYSYKTNKDVGKLIQEMDDLKDVFFSVHSLRELEDISDKKRVFFFVQALSYSILKNLLLQGVRKFVVDNEVDLKTILEVLNSEDFSAELSLRMKFKEHRIGTGKYFVYGMDSKKVGELIHMLSTNPRVSAVGIHIHRKSQNASEWRVKEEIEDSLSKEVLEKIDYLNLGGGIPIKYKSYPLKSMDYIFDKIKESVEFLKKNKIKTFIEPGRFIAGPSVKLECEIIQIYGKTIVLNTTIYNGALDTLITGTKMLVEGELSEEEEGADFLIKGNSPTRDDIFRYKVRLKNPRVGDKIVFINAGAYNYATDFFGYSPLKKEIVEDF